MYHDIMINTASCQKWALKFGPLCDMHPRFEKKRAEKVHPEHKTYEKIKHN